MIFGAGRGEAGIEFAVEGISETIEVKNLLFLVEVKFFFSLGLEACLEGSFN